MLPHVLLVSFHVHLSQLLLLSLTNFNFTTPRIEPKTILRGALGFSVLRIWPIFDSVFRFSLLIIAGFRFWCIVPFAGFLQFSLWFSVFVKNDGGFSDSYAQFILRFFWFCQESHSHLAARSKHSGTFASCTYEELSYPKNQKMCDPILVKPGSHMLPTYLGYSRRHGLGQRCGITFIAAQSVPGIDRRPAYEVELSSTSQASRRLSAMKLVYVDIICGDL